MHNVERNMLLSAYTFMEPLELSVLNEGENTTFLARLEQAPFILRRYRKDRYDLRQIQAEIEWLHALDGLLSVPKAIKNIDGRSVTAIPDSNQAQYYVLFDFIDGAAVDSPSDRDYHNLGEALAILHEGSDSIRHRVTPDWIGFERPVYDRAFLVEEPLKHLWEAPFLNVQDKRQCERLARELSDLYNRHSMDEKLFVHGDAHMGNVLRTGDNLNLLDFDECGFGHRALDIGVPRLHMISSGTVDMFWDSLLNGYAGKLTEGEIRTGTVLRIFYMAGKIPRRLDIGHLRHNPEERIRKYIGYIDKELSGMYAI